LQQIEQEILEVEFEDEAILPGAERLGSGDPLRDWYDSLNAVRRSYAGHYLHEIERRFRLPRAESPQEHRTGTARHGGL
jgi:hypothetical protein